MTPAPSAIFLRGTFQKESPFLPRGADFSPRRAGPRGSGPARQARRLGQTTRGPRPGGPGGSSPGLRRPRPGGVSGAPHLKAAAGRGSGAMAPSVRPLLVLVLLAGAARAGAPFQPRRPCYRPLRGDQPAALGVRWAPRGLRGPLGTCRLPRVPGAGRLRVKSGALPVGGLCPTCGRDGPHHPAPGAWPGEQSVPRWVALPPPYSAGGGRRG